MEPGFSRDVVSVPFHPRRGLRPAIWWSGAKNGLDFVAHNLPRAHQALVRLNPYPRPWRHVSLPMRDGATLAGWYGPGKPGAAALLIVPGTFQTKDDTTRKRRALSLWRRFGLHVLIVDMRGFGGSHAHPSSAGREEALDLHEAADWLRAQAGDAPVHLWGESLGGAISLLAGCLPGAEERFAQVVAWSPFADLGDASLAASKGDSRGQTLLGRTYRWLLRRRDPRVTDFQSYLMLRAEDLGCTVETLLDAGSPARRVCDLRVPSVVFHAEDDPVVPVSHARRLQEVAPAHLLVHVLPEGAHLDFDLVAPAWYDAVTARLFAPKQP